MIETVDWLLSTDAIRTRTTNILNAVSAGQSTSFRVDPRQLDAAAALVVEVTRQRYPGGVIPYHSRWRHFEAAGIDRWAIITRRLGQPPAAGVDAGADAQHLAHETRAEHARSEIDLAVTSVLLDAGAGAAWRYIEQPGASPLTRSEGLGVASLDAFAAGLFSDRPDEPLRADARALRRLTETDLAIAFQVREDNPLIGAAGRVELLRRLGHALTVHSDTWFGGRARPGGLFDRLTSNGQLRSITAESILHALLHALGSIWPAGNQLGGVALGDTWQHPLAGGDGPTANRVPLHKLSQWLTYSLLEPFERAGVTVTGLDSLTALAEYRNGGLLIDTGVITPIDPGLAGTPLAPSSLPIIEWRALTIALMAPLAQRVREQLGAGAEHMPLAKILEGGTWAAGRVIATRLRDGAPPLNIASDGTVF